MTHDKALQLAKTVIANIDHVTTTENPRGSGYFIICSNNYKDDGDLTLQLAFEVCEYEDDIDKHQYYGVYNVPEIDGGDNIAESDWEYTKNCDAEELANIFLEFEKTFTREYLYKLYKEMTATKLALA